MRQEIDAAVKEKVRRFVRVSHRKNSIYLQRQCIEIRLSPLQQQEVDPVRDHAAMQQLLGERAFLLCAHTTDTLQNAPSAPGRSRMDSTEKRLRS